MNLLVIGSGGREHALCWALKRSAQCKALYCSPGNPGIAALAECVSLESHAAMIEFCTQQRIDLVVVGPEQPLVDGLADDLRAAGVAVFGPSAAAAQLEGSKEFTKRLCDECSIPTAAYASFSDAKSAVAYVRALGAPIVVKADGLAAGKGVTVAMTVQEAEAAIAECFDGRFGEAGARVVIEEYLEGEEVSFFALCHGEQVLAFGSAQDHKRVGEGDTGSNTGGMGAYSPSPLMSDAVTEQVMQTIIAPAAQGMVARGTPYCGVLFAGLMMTRDGAKLIEFNCRFGDPETQALMARFEGDLAQALFAVATGEMGNVHATMGNRHALCVVMAAKGYPGEVQKGSEIRNVSAADAMEAVAVFHAGTRLGRNCGNLKANGGRVLGVTAWGETLAQAQQRAYEAVDVIDWPQGFCRRDIGWRAVGKKA